MKIKANKELKISFLIIGMFVSSCSQHLIFPLADGVIKNDGLVDGKVIYIYPRNSFEIKASENSIVEDVYTLDSSYVVLAKGKYEIIYSGILECRVKKGDSLKRGVVLGRLESNHESINFLTLSIRSSSGKIIYKPKFER